MDLKLWEWIHIADQVFLLNVKGRVTSIPESLLNKMMMVGRMAFVYHLPIDKVYRPSTWKKNKVMPNKPTTMPQYNRRKWTSAGWAKFSFKSTTRTWTKLYVEQKKSRGIPIRSAKMSSEMNFLNYTMKRKFMEKGLRHLPS